MEDGKAEKSLLKEEKEKKLKFTLIVVALLLIPTYLIPDNPLFYTSFSGLTSNYGFFVIFFVFFPLLLLSTYGFEGRIHEEGLARKIVNYLGFETSATQAAIGLVLGSSAGLLAWNLGPDAMTGCSLTGSQVLTMLLIAPLFEETIFRGFLINQVLSIGKTRKLKLLAIAASVLIFAWGHGLSPELKVIGGSLYTLLYVWGWNKNLTAAISAHFGGNAVILLSGFSDFGHEVVLMILSIVGLAFLSLMILIWQIENFAQIAIEGFRKLPKMKETE